MKKFKALVLTLLAIFILTTFSGCSLFPGSQTASGPKQTITIWQLFDNKEVFDPIIQDYISNKKSEINVDVVYIKKDYNEYINETVNALAAGKGPDIWMIRNDWMPREYDKLKPMPDTLMTVEQYKQKYPDVAVNDNVIDGKIYGIPWSIDTLVLYYNTNIFQKTRDELINNKSLLSTDSALIDGPLDWEEFIKDIKLLTIKNGNTISRAGAALGTSKNVDRSEDILSALMLQNSTKMVSDDKKSATFNLPISKQSGEPYYAGTKALEFYTAFSNPTKEAYTWNDSMPNSVQAFIDGKVAMMINYGYIRDTLYNQAPTLKYDIAPLPQIKDATTAVDYASYWVETVTNNSKNPALAWDFINYVSKNKTQNYSQSTKRPLPFRPDTGFVPTTKDRVKQKNSVFLFQLTSAQDWYKGQYPQNVDTIFQQMITNVVGGQPLQNTIDAAASDVTTLLRK
ncbi:MAG: extracellular solute-binding protein [Patescibacteria group bacterium]|nr:extracellular solute-binding protein [Patescibacteria group bacterium]